MRLAVHPAVVLPAAAGVSAGVTALVGLLLLAPPSRLPGQVAAGLHAPDGGVALLTALVGVVLWLLAGWLTLAVGAAYAAALPGLAGTAGRAICRRVTPALLRRLIGGSAAVGLALGPALVPVAAAAAGLRGAGPLVGARASAGCEWVRSERSGLPSVDRPWQRCPPAAVPTRPGAAPSASAAPTPRLTPAGPGARDSGRLTTGQADGSPPQPPAAQHSSRAPRPGAEPAPHPVVPGDTLWAVAAAELRADGVEPTAVRTAARWPAWWAANRREVGVDPDLLRPGQVLQPPSAPPAWAPPA